MIRRAALAATLLISGWIASPLAAATLEDRYDRTYPFAAGDELTLRNTNGHVEVEVWDRDEVRIEADKKVRASSRSTAERALEELRIEVETRDGGIDVDTEFPRKEDGGLFAWLRGANVSANVYYRISLPRQADLRLGTVNGKILVRGVDGYLRLRSTNGGIRVEESAGRITARTTNGSIYAELGRVETDGGMSLSTTNGGIALTVPGSLRASLSARTTNGSIETDLPITIQGRHSRRRLEGEINGGGPPIELHTTNGGIRLIEG